MASQRHRLPVRVVPAAPWRSPPLPLTSLVGREREMARLRVLIGGHRLVTLTGPGGCGKTRLAAAVAGSVAEGLGGSVCWVELATLADPALVPQAVARALDVREQPGQQLEQLLCRRLGSAGVLLVLDNCEHLAEACAVLAAELLARCAALRIVATSRAPLGVTGEVVWPVPPLAVPDPGNLPPTPSLLRYEAVRLLADRAAAVEPGFTVDAGNALAVAQVCYRLDGMPLAIELAAARIRVLTVEEIAARLEESFAVLAGRSRTALPQQRTLRATMDWSHDLLTDAERILFRRLSVFAGGFTLEAAEAVCADPDAGHPGVLDVLTSLVDKSLVEVVKGPGGARYRLLETVRQYGLEKLCDAGEEPGVRRRHARFFLDLAERAEPQINTRDRGRWLHRLEAEHDNFRAVLAAGGRDAGDDIRARVAGALVWFWWWRGYAAEGRRWLQLAADERADDRSAVTAKVLSGAGLLGWTRDDHGGALQPLQRSVRLWQELGEQVQLGHALRFLSAHHERRGELDLARGLAEDSVNLFRSVSDRFGLAMSLARLGVTAIGQLDYPAGQAALDESTRICREIGDSLALAIALRHRGIGQLRRGELAPAAASLSEALVLLRDQQDRLLTVQCLETLAAVLAGSGGHFRAARIFGALQAQREALGLSVIYREDHDRAVAIARAGLGPRAFGAAWAAGRALTLEEAAELALAPSAADRPGGLTERELEVLALVAGGLTNEQVAARLFLSARTVNWHLTAVYRKLAVRSRADAVRFAVEHGLDQTPPATAADDRYPHR